MKKLSVLLSSSLLAAAFVFPVHADEYGKSGMGMMKGDGKMGMMKDCMMDMDGMRGDCPMMGAHSMTGMVEKIDYDKGTLTLKHSVTNMMLHFPPTAIKDLKNGDVITVKLGFIKATPAK